MAGGVTLSDGLQCNICGEELDESPTCFGIEAPWRALDLTHWVHGLEPVATRVSPLLGIERQVLQAGQPVFTQLLE
jgi:hypothetical protein